MKNILQQFWKSKGYLLITAAWLITISFIITYWTHYRANARSFAASIEKSLQQKESDYLNLLKDSATLYNLSGDNIDEGILEELYAKNYYLFVYRYDAGGNLQLKFWNTQSIQPDYQILYNDDNRMLLDYSNGDYELIKRSIQNKGQKLMVVGLLPVKYQYFVENDYLRNDFPDKPGEENRRMFSVTRNTDGAPVKSLNGNVLFYIEKNTDAVEPSESLISLLCRLSGLMLIFYFIYLLVQEIEEKTGRRKTLPFLLAAIILMRSLLYLKIFPFNFRQYPLFDPAMYEWGFLIPSLGDLLVNCLLVLWLILFLNKSINKIDYKLIPRNESEKFRQLIVAAGLFVLITLLTGHLVRSLVSNSRISFDVTNFFSLDMFSVTGFVIMGLLSLVYFYLARIILSVFNRSILESGLRFYLAITVFSLAYLSFRVSSGHINTEIFFLLWLLLFVWANQYFKEISILKTTSLSGNLLWAFIFAASISGVVMKENSKASMQQKRTLAENLAVQSDPENQTLLNIAFSNFSSFFFQDNFYRFKYDSVSEFVKDSLIKDVFRGYLNKFDTRIYVYDSAGKPMSGTDDVSLDTLNTIIINQGKRTSIPGLYYYSSSFDRYSYLNKKEIRDNESNLMGFVCIQAQPKKYKSEALYPELFKQRGERPDNVNAYAYAVYDKLKMQDHNSDYPFPTFLKREELRNSSYWVVERDKFSELWYKGENNKVVIVAEPHQGLMNWVSLLAYLFCAFLLIIFAAYGLMALIRLRLTDQKLSDILQLNIRTQIHTTIILASLVSFTIIGFVTINFFTSRYEKNNRERLSKTIGIMKDEVQTLVINHKTFDDGVQIYDEVASQELQKKIESVSEIQNADINLYDAAGNLKVSSTPLLYNKGILSERIHPLAFYQLREKRAVQVIQTEQIGKLKYLSVYVPVLDEDGTLYAFLNIPYFSSQKELKQEISNFLVTIINLNAFIFLLAAVIAFLITNRITGSFSLISEKMKAVNLGKVNEEIVWQRNDEIGGLIKEYNKMVHKLEESAQVLAKTEREGAWREMARQVAHEIKNPLTPMKLSLQYLQKAIHENSGNVKDLSASVAKTLVEQIDHLSKIAADFSQFANIGNPKLEVFNLTEVLETLGRLYNMDERIKFEWHSLQEPVKIRADKTQINRLFTNLLQNASQAMPEDWDARIVMREELKDQRVLVSVADNGLGIPEELQSKIFIPNFTTKSSGTGLGLAMCKGIVEQTGGEIWFETETGKGTVFYVSFPLADS